MKKVTANYIVDILLIITFLLSGVTGILKFPGINLLRSSTTNLIHDWIGIAMVVLVTIHLTLNWDFLVNMTKVYLFKKKNEN